MPYEATLRATERSPFKVLPVTADIPFAAGHRRSLPSLGVIPGKINVADQVWEWHRRMNAMRSRRSEARMLPWIVPVLLLAALAGRLSAWPAERAGLAGANRRGRGGMAADPSGELGPM